LTGASEGDVESFYDSLRELRSSTAADLQTHVFNNYASFVSLSHQISNLTSDLSSLSSLLGQFSTLTQSFSASVQKDDNDLRRRRAGHNNRNSVADLAVIHANHLQELWHFVEGSQKFLPAQSGRHVIKESLNWVELNAATWKPTKTVHLILLNDHLLVAAKKRAKTVRKAVADRCWPLSDIEIKPIEEEGEVPVAAKGGIQVTRGREVAVYVPGEGRDIERTALIQSFERANIDLYNKRKQSNAVSVNGMFLPCFANSSSTGFCFFTLIAGLFKGERCFPSAIWLEFYYW
jgi:exocyst complex component 8